MAYTNILVASDFHDDCLPVIKKAIEIKALNQAKLSLVTVVPNVPYYMASGLSSISDVEEQLEDANHEQTELILTRLRIQGRVKAEDVEILRLKQRQMEIVKKQTSHKQSMLNHWKPFRNRSQIDPS